MDRFLATLIPAAALLCAGCKPPEPVYPSDVDLVSGNQHLLPRGLALTYDDQLLKGRVSGEPDLGQLDLMAVKAVPVQALKLAVGGRWHNLPAALFVPEQAEEIQKFIPVLEPLGGSFQALETAMTSRFGDQLAAMGGGLGDPEQIMAAVRAALDGAQVTLDGEDYAFLTLEMSLPMAPQAPAQEVEIPFAKTDGRWRIDVPYFPPPELLTQVRSSLEGALPGLRQTLEQLRQDVESGAISDPQQLGPRMMASFQGLLPVVMPLVMHVQQAMAAEAAEDSQEAEEEEAGEEGEEGE